MITFDGVDITGVAPVRIDDIRISPVPIEPLARDRAVDAGANFVRNRDGTRTIEITFAILEDNPVTRSEYIFALSSWAKRDAEYQLQFAHVPDKYLKAVCKGFPSPSVRQWWEPSLTLTFTCFENPYWNSVEERSIACGTQFFAQGDAPPLMRIERTLDSSASSQSYSDGTNTMTFSTIPAGDMVIDLNKQTAVVGSTSIMQYYTLTSRFLVPQAGTQTITGTGTVKIRERWT